MPDEREFRFTIHAYTPETIPMGRLAEYMADLAKLLGEYSAVHFVKVEPGSVTLLNKIEDEALPKVRQRVQLTRAGEGPPEAQAAYHRLNTKLGQDNGRGDLQSGDVKVLEFPGRDETEEGEFAFNKQGTLDGIPIRLGGTDEIVPVQLQSGPTVYHCRAERSVARRIAAHIFENEIRLYGTGRWLRNKAGEWNLQRFKIADFEVLDATPLPELVARMRAMPGNEWNDAKDPWAELNRIRNGPDDAQ